jgi:hypothetical protein
MRRDDPRETRPQDEPQPTPGQPTPPDAPDDEREAKP